MMKDELENHMVIRDDNPTIAELNAAIDSINERYQHMLDLMEPLEAAVLSADRFSFNGEVLKDFMKYVIDELDYSEQESERLHAEISSLGLDS